LPRLTLRISKRYKPDSDAYLSAEKELSKTSKRKWAAEDVWELAAYFASVGSPLAGRRSPA
jgi:hypothetical protein